VNIIVPYVPGKLRDETRDCVLAVAPDARFIDVSRNPYDYWYLFRSEWLKEADFIIIEEDMVFNPSDLLEFETCPHQWCTYRYRCEGPNISIDEGLGVVRFRAELQLTVPSLVEERCGWDVLDQMVSVGLRSHHAHFTAHVHGDVDHLHEYTPAVRFRLDRSGQPHYVSGLAFSAE
jgi:hypothetical protein